MGSRVRVPPRSPNKINSLPSFLKISQVSRVCIVSANRLPRFFALKFDPLECRAVDSATCGTSSASSSGGFVRCFILANSYSGSRRKRAGRSSTPDSLRFAVDFLCPKTTARGAAGAIEKRRPLDRPCTTSSAAGASGICGRAPHASNVFLPRGRHRGGLIAD